MERLSYLMGEIPKRKYDLQELNKQLRNRRKVLKNIHQAGEILLKGKLQDLDQKHIQDFSMNFIKKFGSDGNYLNEILLDLYYYR